MAHKKGVGSTDNGRDSKSKRLGVKLFGGQHAIPGNIIIRQRGTKYHPGKGVGMGRDFTIYSLIEGEVTFTKKKKNRTYVNVISSDEVEVMVQNKTAAKKAKPAPKPAAKKEVKAAQPAKETTSVSESSESNMASGDNESKRQELLAKLGAGDPSKKDDLKMIKGVGPKLENMLNDLGMYSFEQISKLTVEDYDTIDHLLDSFKGRAKRDEWAEQAKELLKHGDLLNNPFKAMPDDLKIVEGIGPKIEKLLKDDGINTWGDLAEAAVDRLKAILDAAGDAYRIHQPDTWPQQAGLAHEGKWEELTKWQDELIGGR